MNERIKELAKQAGFDYEQMERNHANGTPSMAETFAELIVKECVDIISPYAVRMSKPGEEYLHPVQEIKQHFGVEE
jgi:hypothetical protein